MEIVAPAICVVQKISGKIEEVATNTEECRALADLAQQTIPVVVQLADYATIQPSVAAGMSAVLEALLSVEAAVDLCRKGSPLLRFLLSRRIAVALRNSKTKLTGAMSLLSASGVAVLAEVQNAVREFQQQLRELHLERGAASDQRTEELRRQMESGRGTESMEMRHTVQALLHHHRVSENALKADMELLQAELQDATANKARLEEFELQQIIAALEASCPTDARPSTELPAHLICPIGLELMTDPVIVSESGQTYDRFQIERWFGGGHRTDPITNTTLRSTEVVTNWELRREVELYTGQRPSDGGSTSQSPVERAPYAGPGLCKIRVQSTEADGCGRAKSLYLVQTDYLRGDFIDSYVNYRVGWQSDVEKATVWRISEVDGAEGGQLFIDYFKGARTVPDGADRALAAHDVHHDDRDEGSCYVASHVFRDAFSSTFKVVEHRGRELLLITGCGADVGRRKVLHFALGVASGQYSLDAVERGTTAAVVYKDWNQAADVSFLYC